MHLYIYTPASSVDKDVAIGIFEVYIGHLFLLSKIVSRENNTRKGLLK